MDAATIEQIKQRAREAVASARELRLRASQPPSRQEADARRVEARIEREHERALARQS